MQRCFLYEARYREIGGEAWLLMWTPAGAVVTAVFSALAAGAGVFLSADSSTRLQALIAAASALGGVVAAYITFVAVGLFRPVRRHWREYVEDMGESLIFNLQSLHDHRSKIWEFKVRVDPPNGQSATIIERAMRLNQSDKTWFQYPYHFEGAPAFDRSVPYRYTWSARREEDGPWSVLFSGEFVPD